MDIACSHVPRATVTGIIDADANGLARELIKPGLNSRQGYSDYQRMLWEVQPDIVAICARHVDQHRGIILAAINACAKGIYVEKPLCPNTKQLDEVVTACRDCGTKLTVDHRNSVSSQFADD